MKNKSFHFILNPISGPNRNPTKIRQNIESFFSTKETISYKLIETEYAGHAKVIAKECAKQNIDCVVAIGGDGTVNEVASGIVGTKTALGILPAGSGNGFARNLNIPLDHNHALKTLYENRIHLIDTGLMNEHFFIGVCGAGFDAHISECFSKVSTRGKWPYFKLSFVEFFSYKLKMYEVNVDEKSFETSAFLLTVANSKEYGNGAQIAPMANSSNGFFDVCVIKKFPLIYIPILIYRLFSGTIHRSKYVIYIQGKCIKIKSHELKLSHVDGEPLKAEAEMEIKINPKSLYVVS